jgi:hypothetical protein
MFFLQHLQKCRWNFDFLAYSVRFVRNRINYIKLNLNQITEICTSNAQYYLSELVLIFRYKLTNIIQVNKPKNADSVNLQ